MCLRDYHKHEFVRIRPWGDRTIQFICQTDKTDMLLCYFPKVNLYYLLPICIPLLHYC
jgi:hypothetical protein